MLFSSFFSILIDKLPCLSGQGVCGQFYNNSIPKTVKNNAIRSIKVKVEQVSIVYVTMPHLTFVTLFSLFLHLKWCDTVEHLPSYSYTQGLRKCFPEKKTCLPKAIYQCLQQMQKKTFYLLLEIGCKVTKMFFQ